MKTLAFLLPLLASSVARADDSFESKAQGAIRVTRAEDFVWALTATCDKGDDTQQRQCRVVRDRKAKQLANATLLIDGDTDALELGTWSAAKKSVPMSLGACIRCNGIEVEGKTYYLTGPGAKLDGGKVRAQSLYDNARPIADEGSAVTWKNSVAGSRFELVVKLGDKKKQNVGGKDVLGFDILAWRVVNACDGALVIASGPSGPGTPDKKACRAAAGGGGGGGGNTSADLPDALTPTMVNDAMRPVVAAARACFNRMKSTPGKTKLEITINADGSIAKHEQVGDFTGTPLGKCIDDALAKTTFPKTKKASTKIGYPLALQ
jgi:hypothetical protein